MAARRQTARRRQQHSETRNRQEYVYGNAVREPEAVPRRQREIQEPERQKRTSKQVRKNRNRALHMNPAYVTFLAVSVCMAVFICIQYLQLQSEIRNRSENITSMQKELAALTEENDTAYNVALDAVNIEDIRNKAMNEMGMVYASDGQVVEYESPSSNSVKQYEEIPADGILAQSK